MMKSFLVGFSAILIAAIGIIVAVVPSTRQLDWEGEVVPNAQAYAEEWIQYYETSDQEEMTTITNDSNASSLSLQKEKPLSPVVAVVTGATSGIGKSLTKALLTLGATVVAVGRSPSKLQALEQEFSSNGANTISLVTVRADFNDLDTVASAANTILQQFPRIDFLINNAGAHDSFSNLMGTKQSAQGMDSIFTVNYLSHVLFTERLAPALHQSPAPVIVQVSSSYHWGADGADLKPTSASAPPLAGQIGGATAAYIFRSSRSYVNSKLAQILHARALQRKHPLLSQSITTTTALTRKPARIVSVCPGWVSTNIVGSGHVMEQFLHQLAFDSDEWGLASILTALTDLDTTHDFYMNSEFLSKVASLYNYLPPWAFLRDVVTFGMAMSLLWMQRLQPAAIGFQSSKESYDMELADSLYEWSVRAVTTNDNGKVPKMESSVGSSSQQVASLNDYLPSLETVPDVITAGVAMSVLIATGAAAVAYIPMLFTLPTSKAFSPSLEHISRIHTRPTVMTPLFSEGNEDIMSGLLLSKDAKSQLFASFSALSLADQYDAVLTGLCAKIVDGTAGVTEGGEEGDQQAPNSPVDALADPMNLLQEMNQKRIVASPRSMMALIDATAKAQDASILGEVMSLSMRNGGTSQFGNLQASILSVPNNPQSSFMLNQVRMTRAERLENGITVPTDERVAEVGSALTTLAVAGACELTDFVPGLDGVSPVAHVILTSMLIVGVLDNFYDLIQSASNFAAGQAKNDQIQKAVENLPDKGSLPFGLGSGQVTGQVVRGLSRLFTVDPAREAQTEAAALFVAYSLGLPVFCFRANALEASVLAVENSQEYLSDRGVLRLLMWLLAPVAAESAQYPVLISSDPREASGFLERLEQVAITNPTVAQALWWLDDSTTSTRERNDLLQWAFLETDSLLRDNKRVVQELAQRLEGGAATIADCVAVLEQW